MLCERRHRTDGARCHASLRRLAGAEHIQARRMDPHGEPQHRSDRGSFSLPEPPGRPVRPGDERDRDTTPEPTQLSRALRAVARTVSPTTGRRAAHPIGSNNLFHQLGRRGWRSYEQSMPRNCARSDAGRYAVRHNPAAYYSDLARSCRRRDVPLRKLRADLSRRRLARFSFITPNLCNDEHDCSVSTGDHWLSQAMPAIHLPRISRLPLS